MSRKTKAWIENQDFWGTPKKHDVARPHLLPKSAKRPKRLFEQDIDEETMSEDIEISKLSERKGMPRAFLDSTESSECPTTDGEMENSRRIAVEPDSVPNVSRRHRGKSIDNETFTVDQGTKSAGIGSQPSELYQHSSTSLEKGSNSQLSSDSGSDSIDTTHGEDGDIPRRSLSNSRSKTKSYVANERTRTIRRASALNDETKVLRPVKDKENVENAASIDNQTKTILRAQPKFKNAHSKSPQSGISDEGSGSDPSFNITRPNLTGNWPRAKDRKPSGKRATRDVSPINLSVSTKPSQPAPKKSTRAKKKKAKKEKKKKLPKIWSAGVLEPRDGLASEVVEHLMARAVYDVTIPPVGSRRRKSGQVTRSNDVIILNELNRRTAESVYQMVREIEDALDEAFRADPMAMKSETERSIEHIQAERERINKAKDHYSQICSRRLTAEDDDLLSIQSSQSSRLPKLCEWLVSVDD